MWLTYFLSTIVVASLASCTPAASTEPVRYENSTGRHLVTGVAWRDGLGHVPIRREIRDLKNNFPDQWSLYLLGLRAFHDSEQTNPLSFYEISGIHGRPYKVWQDAQGLPGKLGGYCPHQNPLFLAWHRPYLVLYEQEIYKYVRDIALRSAPHLVERFASAADSFRLPYWDWALGEKGGSIPDFFTTPTIQVVGPDGLNQAIANPLYRYDFDPLIPGDFEGQWSTQNRTLRWPTSGGSTADSQNGKFVKDFEGQRRGWLDQVSAGFGRSRTLNAFSTDYIEMVHGWVHYTIAGAPPVNTYTGHMWPVEYSAFEPLFLLHHCNVDRLFALWQVVNPDKWFVPESVKDKGNFVLADNQIVDGNTPLSPFWTTSTTFWTSNDVQDTISLGYAYPETQSWLYSSSSSYRTAVNATIAQLYSSSVRNMLSAGVGENGHDFNHLIVDGSFTDWSVELSAVSSTLPPTFQVRFSFIGDFSSDPVKDVGMWNVMMPSTHRDHQTKTESRKRASTLEKNMKGSVALTANLLDCIAAGQLGSLGKDDVVPFLKSKLTWLVYQGDGALIPNTALQGLTVQVASTIVRIPEHPDQPLAYSDDLVVHPEVTAGKGSV
ncbi:Di-copper centre-containing protein [Melanomma pulvis-pyrius CBS 109.77]|uniref:tyrosinase n=1 Tax=Melanomma pulvis-pyrius CBS 109.77 TaxID=1314802 RepID=A0A6A6X999_9PLEO|nr:Di-copper centre-containing protein [Melanomma pulvis-pyrius CBS 109.77]